MSGAESLLQTVVASNIEVSFVNFGTTEVPWWPPLIPSVAPPLRPCVIKMRGITALYQHLK